MALRLSVVSKNESVRSLVSALDSIAGPGMVQIRNGIQPASANDAATGILLATFTLSLPAFGAPVAGIARPNPINAVPASVTGTATWFRARDFSGVTVMDGSVSGIGQGGNMELNTVTLTAGVSVDILTWIVIG